MNSEQQDFNVVVEPLIEDATEEPGAPDSVGLTPGSVPPGSAWDDEERALSPEMSALYSEYRQNMIRASRAMEYPDHEEMTVQIASTLRRMTEAGGGHNFVIVQVGRCHYVQFATSCGSAVMYGEASSGRYCTPGCTCAPTAAQQARLRSLGWRPPTRRKFLNFYRWWPLITERDRQVIAETAIATLRVFGWRGEPLKVKFHLDW